MCCPNGLAWYRAPFTMGPLCTSRLMNSHFPPATNLPPFTLHFSHLKSLAFILLWLRMCYSPSLEYLFFSPPPSKCLLLQDLDQIWYLHVTLNACLLHTRSCCQYISYRISFLFDNCPGSKLILKYPFYPWRNWKTEKLIIVPDVTQLLCDRPRMWT